jgi:murein DD-endopeptidase MepM/ murein hydrolase activator NlpD
VIDETTLDGSEWRWYYAHLAFAPLVRPGDMVVAGQIIGYLGRTGNAIKRAKDGSFYGCPHLHLALTGSNDKALRSAREKGLKVAGGKVDSVPLLRPLFDAGKWR